MAATILHRAGAGALIVALLAFGAWLDRRRRRNYQPPQPFDPLRDNLWR